MNNYMIDTTLIDDTTCWVTMITRRGAWRLSVAEEILYGGWAGGGGGRGSGGAIINGNGWPKVIIL